MTPDELTEMPTSGDSEEVCVQVTVASDAGIDARFKIVHPTFHFVAVGVS
ncbi:hypothetical protein GCM10022294_24470 [Dietzia aurantiaca]